jgi:protein O-GlcNAc transferase
LVPSFKTALTLAKSGHPRDALAEAMAAYEQEAPSVELFTLIGELHIQLTDPAAAAEYFRRATSLTPLDAAAHRRLAGAEFSAGFATAAIASYRRALALEPSNVRAHNNLGRVLERMGDPRGAAECYRQALALDETYAIAHNNLGNILAASGQASEALMRYQRAAALRPDFVEAWVNCAKTLLTLQRPAEALTGSDKAIASGPDFAEAWFVRGETLNALERYQEALSCCERSLALRPDHPQALYARANLRRGMGDFRGAVAGFREALRIKPDYEAARLGAVIAEIPALAWTAAEAADSRAAFALALAELDAHLQRDPCANATTLVGAVQPFYLAYQEEDNRALLETHGRLCANLMGEWQRSEALIPPGKGSSVRPKPRVAFVSAQVANHSVYNAITRGWLQRLDRKRFVVDVFHLGGTTDAETESARGAADHFEQGPHTIREWAKAIIDRCPDILVYPEVGMDQTTLQLAGMRLARTQLVAWGHPVTSGLPTLDYYLSGDAFEPPDGASHYTEQLVRLPHFGVYCEPQTHESAAAPTTTANDGTDPVLVCAGTPFKYSPQHDVVLVDIARRLGRCQFHFFNYRDGVLSRRLLSRLHEAFSAAGLDGRAHLVLRPWASAPEFHAVLRSADVYLDTIGFSGFNSVMQALQCGLPVVSCRGRFMRGRLGSGMLERLSLPNLVADGPRSYVDIAVSLAESRHARSWVRDQLRMNLPSVHRDQSAIEKLEEFLLSVA